MNALLGCMLRLAEARGRSRARLLVEMGRRIAEVRQGRG
jgi:hypothetical protein